jgi:hypothetical protein
MAGYGIGMDYFGLASASLKLISSKANLLSASVAKAQDEDGNEVAETKFAADGPSEVECVYDLVASTLNTNTLKLGRVGSTDVICSGIAGKTSNGSWPQITMKGVSGTGMYAKFTNIAVWTCPSFVLNGKRSAMLIGATLGEGASVTGSSFALDGKIDYHRESGTVIAAALTGAELKVTNEAVETTGAIAWTAATPFAATDKITTSGDTKATDYATGSIELTKTYNHDA